MVITYSLAPAAESPNLCILPRREVRNVPGYYTTRVLRGDPWIRTKYVLKGNKTQTISHHKWTGYPARASTQRNTYIVLGTNQETT